MYYLKKGRKVWKEDVNEWPEEPDFHDDPKGDPKSDGKGPGRGVAQLITTSGIIASCTKLNLYLPQLITLKKMNRFRI